MPLPLNNRERKALMGCLSLVADPREIAGVGAETWAALVRRGLVEFVRCETFGTEGYLSTEAGRQVLNIR